MMPLNLADTIYSNRVYKMKMNVNIVSSETQLASLCLTY